MKTAIEINKAIQESLFKSGSSPVFMTIPGVDYRFKLAQAKTRNGKLFVRTVGRSDRWEEVLSTYSIGF